MTTDSAAQEPRPQQHSESAQPASGAAAPARSESGGKPPTRTGPRTGPIVWGALILAFCGYAAQRAFGTGGMDTAWWITATVIGLGVLLLAVGVAVAVRNRG